MRPRLIVVVTPFATLAIEILGKPEGELVRPHPESNIIVRPDLVSTRRSEEPVRSRQIRALQMPSELERDYVEVADAKLVDVDTEPGELEVRVGEAGCDDKAVIAPGNLEHGHVREKRRKRDDVDGVIGSSKRDAFFELIVEGRSLDVICRARSLDASTLARRARRALDVLRHSAPPPLPTPAAP